MNGTAAGALNPTVHGGRTRVCPAVCASLHKGLRTGVQGGRQRARAASRDVREPAVSAAEPTRVLACTVSTHTRVPTRDLKEPSGIDVHVCHGSAASVNHCHCTVSVNRHASYDYAVKLLYVLYTSRAVVVHRSVFKHMHANLEYRHRSC